MCIVPLFCVKKPTKTKKQMFIFYVSWTLYKLLGSCWVEKGPSFVVAIFVLFPCVLTPWQESSAVCPPPSCLTSVPRGGALFTELPSYSSLLLLRGSRPKSHGTHMATGVACGRWWDRGRQTGPASWGPRLLVGPP